MPISDEMKNAIKGAKGDISNTGSIRPLAGASTAAAFILRFIDKDVKWAHLDIAGPSNATTAKPPICADQTGFGAALLFQFIMNKK